MVVMAASNLLRSSTLVLVVVSMALCTLCALPPFSAAQSTSPALPSAAEGSSMPSGDEASAGTSSATHPAAAATTALPPSSSSAAATGSKKFPLPAAGGQYLPAAEVASALPVPMPDEFPSAASLGFGEHGDECCGGGGYGWFGGPGGFGPGTYGYHGPLYFGAAPAATRGFGNVLVPLVVACVSAAMCV